MQWFDSIRRAVDELIQQVVGFLPNLFAAILLLAVGWTAGRLLAAGATRVVRRIKLDAEIDQGSWREAMKRAGVQLTPSEIVGRVVFWTVLLVFVAMAVENLGIALTAVPLRSFVGYLPRILGAVLILFLGAVLAGVLGKAFSAGLAGLDLAQHRIVAKAAQGLVFLVTFLAAFDHLGFDVTLLSSTISNLITIFGAAMALAFVLGGRDVARDMLAGYYVREQYKVGSNLRVGEAEGELLGIGTLSSTIKVPDGDLVIPNHSLIEKQIMRIDADSED